MKILFTIFFGSFLTFAYFYQGGGHNQAARFDTVRAFLDEKRLIVDTFAYNSGDLIRLGGHYYSGKAPGTAYLALPSFWFFRKILRPFYSDDQLYHRVCWLSTVFSVSLLAALLPVFLFLWLRRAGYLPRQSVLLSISLVFGTIFFPWSTILFSHVVVATLGFLAYYQLYSAKADRAVWRFLLCGFSLGFAITTEYPAVITAFLLGIYFLSGVLKKQFRLSSAGFIILGLAAGLFPLLLYNFVAFGNIFYIPYEAYASSTNSTFTAHQKGILGIRIVFLEPAFWPIFINNFLEITIRPLRGILYVNPLIWLLIPSLFMIKRWNDDVLLALLVILAYLTFNASFGDSITYWGGGYSFGPRYLVTAIPFLVVPLSFLLRSSRWTWIMASTALVSAAICFMATAVDMQTPYAPANPLWDLYLPQFKQGILATNKSGIFSNSPVTNNSVAFNIGKLFGLPGLWQLLPLLVVWIGISYSLKKLTDPANPE